MHVKSLAIVCALALLIGVSQLRPAAAAGRRGSHNGAQQQQQMRQQQIAIAQQQLALGQQALSAAETAISTYKSDIASATGNIEGARKTIDEAKSSTTESRKSLKTIEAEILAAQAENSDYGRASAAFQTAQDELKEAKETALGSAPYVAQKASLTKDEGHSVKLAKFERETLADDAAYQRALDKAKSTKIAYDRAKSELFKANADWAAATATSRQASADESKAKSEATKGAVKKMPAMRNLRDAEAAAEEARVTIAQATAVLRQFNALPKAAQGKKR